MVCYDERIMSPIEGSHVDHHPPDPIVVALAARRRALNLSQATIAERVGTSRGHLSRIEVGHIDPAFSLVCRYADAVGLDLLAAERTPASATTSAS